MHWVPSNQDYAYSSNKEIIHGISQSYSVFDEDYVVAAELQELRMGIGDGGKNLDESLMGIQTDSDPPETRQLQTTPEIMPACAQWGMDSQKVHLYSGGLCSPVHITCELGTANTASKQRSAQKLLKHPVLWQLVS